MGTSGTTRQYLFQVYMVTNRVNGKRYIGKAVYGAAVRWAQHVAGYCKTSALTRAIRKYGADNFEMKVLYEGVNNDELCRVERAMIAQYGTFSPRGYNLTIGGEGVTGFKMSAETKSKKSKIATAWQTGRKLAAKHLESMRLASTGRVFSEESRRKKSVSMKNAWAQKSRIKHGRPKINRAVISLTTGDIYETWKAADAARGLSVGLTRKHMDRSGQSRGEVFKPLTKIAFERPWP